MGTDREVTPRKTSTSTSARRALRVLEILKGQTLYGLSNAEIARALDETPVNITRTLGVLMESGFVQKLDTGRYAHSIKLLQIAQAHANELASAQSRLLEITHRVAVGTAN